METSITINFISSKDIDEERVMHLKSDNMEIMVNNETDEVLEKFFNHFFLDIKLG